MQSCSDAEEQADGCQHPLSWLLFGFQVEGPDVGGAADARLVDGALVHVLRFLPVHRDGLDEEDGHCRSQLLQTRVADHAGLGVPASTWTNDDNDTRHTPTHTYMFTWTAWWGKMADSVVCLALFEIFPPTHQCDGHVHLSSHLQSNSP